MSPNNASLINTTTPTERCQDLKLGGRMPERSVHSYGASEPQALYTHAEIIQQPTKRKQHQQKLLEKNRVTQSSKQPSSRKDIPLAYSQKLPLAPHSLQGPPLIMIIHTPLSNISQHKNTIVRIY